MASKNDITGDKIATKHTSDAFRNNYDTIFGKGKRNETVSQNLENSSDHLRDGSDGIQPDQSPCTTN